MPISNSYPKGIPIEDQDLFVGTKAYNNRTVNYTAQGVADYLNINSKVAIGGQMSFQFTIVPNIPKTIAFEGGLGNNTAFSAITKLIVSAIDVSTANITIFLNYLNNSQILLSQQNQPNFFGHYKITGYTQIGTSAFYELDLEFIGGNGTIGDKQYYDLVSFVLSTETPPTVWGSITGDIEDQTDLIDYISSQITIPTLSEVLAEGNTTGGENIVINDADAIQLENSSTLKKGTYDFGADGGISRICGVGFEDMWQSGIRHVFDSNGLIRNSTNGFNIVPDASFDNTLRFKVDSLWTLDNGDTYKCTDASTGAAVWELVNTGSIPTLQQVTDALLVDGIAVTTNGIQAGSCAMTGDGIFQGFEGANIFSVQNGQIIFSREVISPAAYGSVTLDYTEPLEDYNTVFKFKNTGGIKILANEEDIPSFITQQKTSSFTALNGILYSTNGTITVTDANITGVVPNQGYIVYVVGGTTTIGGVGYTTGDLVYRFYNGSSWLSTNMNSANGVTSVGLTMPSAFTVTNSPITSSGDIAVTGAGSVSQYVRGDGSLANFPASTGGGASLSFYLNGSVSQGTIGGIAFREMDRTPILGAGTDFTINANGYIQSFITDAGVPNLLEIPAGNWNFETYFSASSGGGSPSFYIELYKWNGTTLSLIASNSASPRLITDGTNIEAYFSALAVPQTTLLATDRLAVRIYVTHSGRTITLHTEDNNLCQVITTFTTGLTALNGLTDQVQFFDVGTGATNFNISSSGDTHTFNLLFNIRRNANNSSNNNINYNGYAVTGSAESSAVWTITRLTIAASGSITVATATNVAWTDRESAIYT